MVFGSGNIIFAFLALPVPSAIVFSHAVCVAWGLASFRIRRRFDGASAATLVELVSVIAAPVVIAVGMFLTIADSSVWLYRRLKVVGRHQYDKAPAA
jgi:ABC-type sulfate transport system permease subunit